VVSRRDFLLAGTAAGAVVGAGVLVPLAVVLADEDAAVSGASGARLASFPRTRVASVSGLAVGEPQFFDYPFEGQSNIIVKTGNQSLGGVGDDRDIVSYSNLCTHMGCPVTEYQIDSSVLGPCPCHFSSFDLSRDGQVGFGQATQNLPRILLEVDSGDIYATGVFRLVYGQSDSLASAGLTEVGNQS